MMTDDKAVTAGIGFFNGLPVTVIAQEKNENFGMCSPQGYRKALTIDETGREISPTGTLLCRHAGRSLWNWKQRSADRERQSQEIFLKCHHLKHRFFP